MDETVTPKKVTQCYVEDCGKRTYPKNMLMVENVDPQTGDVTYKKVFLCTAHMRLLLKKPTEKAH